MKTDRIPYHLYWNAFENARWILTGNKSGEVTEYHYSEMSRIVKDAYISWHNSYLAKPPYNEEELKPENVIVRYLHQVVAGIARRNKGDIVGIRYSDILPDYTINCYDWRYQCNYCKGVFDEIRGKGQERVNRLYCVSCHKYSEYR